MEKVLTAPGSVPLTTQGDLLTRDANVLKRLAAGNQYEKLTMGASEPEWVAGGIFHGVTSRFGYVAQPDLSSTPRTATVSSVSGDVITLTAAVAKYFFDSNMAGLSYALIYNTTRSEYAWIIDVPSTSTLQVSVAGDISAWSNGDTVSTAYDGASSAYVEIDLSPAGDIPTGASHIYMSLGFRDTGAGTAYKGLDAKTATGTGTTFSLYHMVANLMSRGYGFVSIDSNQHILVRDRATGSGTIALSQLVVGGYII